MSFARYQGNQSAFRLVCRSVPENKDGTVVESPKLAYKFQDYRYS